jgi:hypothetical protein
MPGSDAERTHGGGPRDGRARTRQARPVSRSRERPA